MLNQQPFKMSATIATLANAIDNGLFQLEDVDGEPLGTFITNLTTAAVLDKVKEFHKEAEGEDFDYESNSDGFVSWLQDKGFEAEALATPTKIDF